MYNLPQNFSFTPRYLFSWFGFDTTELVCANLETKKQKLKMASSTTESLPGGSYVSP